MKELAKLYEDGRKRITVQVERFEGETKQKALELLVELREELWEDQDIDLEFRNAKVDDLAKLNALTKTGKLSVSATGPLRERVAQDKTLQDRTRLRLMELENRSYKAGLKAPLTRDHVEHFLFFEDRDYEKNIERILTAEMARQDAIESQERERSRRQQEAEEKERLARAQDEQEKRHSDALAPRNDAPPAPPAPEEGAKKPQADQNGKIAWSVRCE